MADLFEGSFVGALKSWIRHPAARPTRHGALVLGGLRLILTVSTRWAIECDPGSRAVRLASWAFNVEGTDSLDGGGCWAPYLYPRIKLGNTSNLMAVIINLTGPTQPYEWY